MGFWRGRGKEPPEKPAPVQLRPADRHPFSLIDGYVPLHQPEFSLYRAIREAVPVVDAAVLKLVRLAGGVGVTCQDKEAEGALNHFLRTVPVGWNQKGIQAFLDSYLDCLLTCGRAVGEIVPSRDGRDIAAVLCGRVSDVQVKEGDSPLEVLLALRRPDGRSRGAASPGAAALYPVPPQPGASVRGVPAPQPALFVGGAAENLSDPGRQLGTGGQCPLCRGVQAGGRGAGPPAGAGEKPAAGPASGQRPWRAPGPGHVRDFVAVGDVEIKVIGAECAIPDCQAPVRHDSGAADRPDGDSSLPAGAELVLHRADEQPAGGHYDQ